MKGSPSKLIALKTDVIGTGKYTVCRRVRASFSPEILQGGEVKGLTDGRNFLMAEMYRR